jgi:hypothetical protein
MDLNIQFSNPCSKKHTIGLKWYASMTSVFAMPNIKANSPEPKALKKAMEFYSIYAETADEKYLKLSEDFLLDSLKEKKEYRYEQ